MGMESKTSISASVLPLLQGLRQPSPALSQLHTFPNKSGEGADR